MKYLSGGYGLHEVYYNNGEPRGMTEELCKFSTSADEGADGIVRSLERALHDARTRGVLDESEIPSRPTGGDDDDSDEA